MSLELNGTNRIVYDNLNDNIVTLLKPKNWIINGGFDVWQRGTSQTSSGYGSDDRWTNENGTSTKTHSRQAFTVGQTDVPNNPTYFSRTVVTSGGTSTSQTLKYQKIEDVTKLGGRTISVSFWAKADASKNLSIELYQFFGTGGSAGVSAIGVQKFSLTTSWQRFTKTLTIPSVSGKTIGSNNSLLFSFWFDAGSDFNANTDSLGNQSGTFDIANVTLVEGSVPMEWQTEAYADVLRQCQRYYQRFGGEASSVVLSNGFAYLASIAFFTIPLLSQMRTIPSSIEYSNVAIDNIGSSNISISSISLPSTNGNKLAFIQVSTSSLTAYRQYGLITTSINGYVALSAEL